VRNPLFLLDEIDKLGWTCVAIPLRPCWKCWIPSRTQLQRSLHGVDYDLSDVMFVATSNSLNIPGPLLDRMEVIRLAGYTEDEKLNIAKTASAAQADQEQRREGVRTHASRIPRHHPLLHPRSGCAFAGARDLQDLPQGGQGRPLKSNTSKVRSTTRTSRTSWACASTAYGKATKENQVGQVVGLAWTEVGGDLLTIEAANMPGKGKIIRTGSAGRCDEGVHPGRPHRGAQPCRSWASRTTCSRSATSTSTCPMAPPPRMARAPVPR
jgi:ATP-dependent Lon protease